MAKAATSTIPIVFQTGADPIADGLVVSMNRPGGNITGVSRMTVQLEPKRIELLHEAVPKVNVFALLVNRDSPRADLVIEQVQKAPRSLALNMTIVKVSTENELDSAFAAMAREGVGALLVSNDPAMQLWTDKIVALTMQHALPAMSNTRSFVPAGGLMSYDSSIVDSYRQTGVYAGRILKGEKPADLPILGCAVIVVHHCGIDATRPRGHTSLTGAVDAQLAVKRDALANIVVAVERMKDGPEGDCLTSKLESIEVGTDSDGDPITSCVVVPVDGDASWPATNRNLSDRQQLALDALTDCAVEQGKPPPVSFGLPTGLLAVELSHWRDELRAQGTLDQDAANPRQDFPPPQGQPATAKADRGAGKPRMENMNATPSYTLRSPVASVAPL